MLSTMLDVRSGASAFRDRKLGSVMAGRLPCLLPILLAAGDDSALREGAKRRLVLRALETITDALGRADPGEEAAVVQRLEQTGTLGAIVKLCSSTPVSDADVLHLSLLSMSNGAWMGAEQALVEMGAMDVPVRVLTARPLAPLRARSAAVAALYNLLAARHAYAAIPSAAHAPLLEAVDALVADASCHFVATDAKRRLKIFRKSARREAPHRAAERAVERARSTEEALQRALGRAAIVAAQGPATATRRLQSVFRMGRDAMRGTEELRGAKGAEGAAAGGRGVSFREELSEVTSSIGSATSSASASALLNVFLEYDDGSKVEPASPGGAIGGAQCCGCDLFRWLARRREARAFAQEHALGAARVLRKQSGRAISAIEQRRRLKRHKVTRLGVVGWAVEWMKRKYPHDFWVCIAVILLCAAALAALPLAYERLFNDILPRVQDVAGADCTVDFAVTGGYIVLSSLLTIVLQYKLDISKMDGAGFVPLFQKDLCQHIVRLPQLRLDATVETDLLAMLEKDVARLNDVISAFFDMFGSLMELLFLLPVLFYLQWELTCFCLCCIPLFIGFQYRQGSFIIAATEALVVAENKYMRFIEENLVFATTRKLLGLGPAMDAKLGEAQEAVVEKFDVLDFREAASTAQLGLFNLMMKVGVIGCGVYLMLFAKVEAPDEVDFVCLAEPCHFWSSASCPEPDNETTPSTNTTTVAELVPRLDIATLFSFLQGTDALFPICLTIISCMRKFQVGTASVTRVIHYLNDPIDPWEDHASQLRRARQRSKSLRTWRRGLGAASIAALGKGQDVVRLDVAIVRMAKDRDAGVRVDSKGVVTKLRPGGPAARGGVRAGDAVLSVDGKKLQDGPAETKLRELLRSNGLHQISLRRDKDSSAAHDVERKAAEAGGLAAEAGGLLLEAKSLLMGTFELDAREISAPTRAGERIGIDLHVDGSQLFVKSIQPSSPFAGQLRTGEQLLEVNGQRVSGYFPRKAVAMLKGSEGVCVLRVRQTRGLIKLHASAAGGARGVSAESYGVASLRTRFGPAAAPQPLKALLPPSAGSPRKGSEPGGKSMGARGSLPPGVPREKRRCILPGGATSPPKVHPSAKPALVLPSPFKLSPSMQAAAAEEGSSPPPSAITISNVSFKFSDERHTLERCDMALPAGAKACLLGRSGSGKTTLLKTMARLYQPLEGGGVQLFGEPLNDVDLPSVLSYMEQHSVAFAGSVRSNLTIGLGERPDDEIRAACQQAQVPHAIEISPEPS